MIENNTQTVTPTNGPSNGSAASPEPVLTAAAAHAALRADADRRIKECAAEIDAVLRKHGCALDAQVTISSAGVDRRVQIIAQQDVTG